MISNTIQLKKITTVGLSSWFLFSPLACISAEEQGLLQRRSEPSSARQFLNDIEEFTKKSLVEMLAKFGPKGSGTLAMYDSHHRSVGDCVLQHTDVSAKISGYMARVTVTQKFHNPHNQKVEAVYTFPLPDQSAVDDMTMKIGDRTIKGEIKERGEAHKIYSEAAAQGYTAALLDQERPNIFTQSVANVEPGADINVEISYTQILPYENGQYAFIFPTVVGERFIPGASRGDGLQGERNSGSSLVPDAALITPPVKNRAGHDISLTVQIDGGVPISNVHSELHDVETRFAENTSVVTLKQKNEIPNRDFILTWNAAGKSIESGYLAHKDGSDGYVTLMMMPPKRVAREDVAPREMIFVVDCSGSMSGRPIEKCKETMHYVLDQMRPSDTFQILTFNNNSTELFPSPQPVSARNKRIAQKFISGLQAEGGTYINSAIEAACRIPASNNRLRIVTVMTDGDVGNEFDAVNLVKRLRGKSRWFPFGIGNGSNTLILNKMAEEGGGEAKLITLETPSKQVVRDFYAKISSPVLTDVRLSVEGDALKEIYPQVVSDVWAQKPLYFKARYNKAGKARVTLNGFSGGKPYLQTLELNLPDREVKNGSVAQVWAKAKIDDLMSQDYYGVQVGTPKPDLKKEIISTALANHIMSQYTSFVAVDRSRKTQGGVARRVDVPVEPVSGTSGSAGSASYGGGDAFDSTADTGNYTGSYTGSQTAQGSSSTAPSLQGGTNGTIGPQGADATVIQGVNTGGTVRVNNLANLEALVNIIANGLEILGTLFGLLMVIGPFKASNNGGELNSDTNAQSGKKRASCFHRFLLGLFIIAVSLSVPGMINWMVALARDNNIFS